MIYLRSILAGLAAAVIAMVVLPTALVLWAMAQYYHEADGSGGIGSVSAGFGDVTSIAAILFVVAVFAAGFYWQFRRARQGKSFMNLMAALTVVLCVVLFVVVCGWYLRPNIEWLR